VTTIAHPQAIVNFDLSIARHLVSTGTPLIIARRYPDGRVQPVDKNWQHSKPDPVKLDEWFEGRGDILGAVMGWSFDAFDFDPQNGCTLAEFLEYYHSLGHKSLTVQAIVATPSGGHHLWVNSLNKRKRNPITRGVDYQGQLTWVAIPPSRKNSKITGEMLQYLWTEFDPGGSDDGEEIYKTLSDWPNHTPFPTHREGKQHATDKMTKARVREYREEGIGGNEDHDNTLAQIVYCLCLWGATEDVALEIWQQVVDSTELKGREYDPERDFQRQWNGAVRKLR
jgi:hypothetical protein